jgi:hypothetical protein
MDKITNITITDLDGNKREMILIDHGNNEFTSMLKSTYDELKANEAAAE